MRLHQRTRTITFALTSAAMIAAGWLPLGAQEPSKAKNDESQQQPALKKGYDPTRRVPSFFGQIGLTPEQREEIYKVRAKHFAKISEIEKELAKARAEMVTECEKILNDTQKQLLEVRRQAAQEKRKLQVKAKTAAAVEKPAEKKSD